MAGAICVEYVWPPVLTSGQEVQLTVCLYAPEAGLTARTTLTNQETTLLEAAALLPAAGFSTLRFHFAAQPAGTCLQLALACLPVSLVSAGPQLSQRLRHPYAIPLLSLPFEAAGEINRYFDGHVKSRLAQALEQRRHAEAAAGPPSSPRGTDEHNRIVGQVYRQHVLPLLLDMRSVLQDAPYHVLRVVCTRMAPKLHGAQMYHCLSVLRELIRSHNDFQDDLLAARPSGPLNRVVLGAPPPDADPLQRQFSGAFRQITFSRQGTSDSTGDRSTGQDRSTGTTGGARSSKNTGTTGLDRSTSRRSLGQVNYSNSTNRTLSTMYYSLPLPEANETEEVEGVQWEELPMMLTAEDLSPRASVSPRAGGGGSTGGSPPRASAFRLSPMRAPRSPLGRMNSIPDEELEMLLFSLDNPLQDASAAGESRDSSQSLMLTSFVPVQHSHIVDNPLQMLVDPDYAPSLANSNTDFGSVVGSIVAASQEQDPGSVFTLHSHTSSLTGSTHGGALNNHNNNPDIVVGFFGSPGTATTGTTTTGGTGGGGGGSGSRCVWMPASDGDGAAGGAGTAPAARTWRRTESSAGESSRHSDSSSVGGVGSGSRPGAPSPSRRSGHARAGPGAYYPSTAASAYGAAGGRGGGSGVVVPSASARRGSSGQVTGHTFTHLPSLVASSALVPLPVSDRAAGDTDRDSIGQDVQLSSDTFTGLPSGQTTDLDTPRAITFAGLAQSNDGAGWLGQLDTGSQMIRGSLDLGWGGGSSSLRALKASSGANSAILTTRSSDCSSSLPPLIPNSPMAAAPLHSVTGCLAAVDCSWRGFGSAQLEQQFRLDWAASCWVVDVAVLGLTTAVMLSKAGGLVAALATLALLAPGFWMLAVYSQASSPHRELVILVSRLISSVVWTACMHGYLALPLGVTKHMATWFVTRMVLAHAKNLCQPLLLRSAVFAAPLEALCLASLAPRGGAGTRLVQMIITCASTLACSIAIEWVARRRFSAQAQDGFEAVQPQAGTRGFAQARSQSQASFRFRAL